MSEGDDMNNTAVYEESNTQHKSDSDGSEGSFRFRFYGGCSSSSTDESTAERMKEMAEVYKEYLSSSGWHVYDDENSEGSVPSGHDSVSDCSAYDDLEEEENHLEDATLPEKKEKTSEELATKLIKRTSTMSIVGLSVALSHESDGEQGKTSSPMCLPNFKPAEGCTDSSEFVIRCFLSRLREGMTVMKYSRSRWSKSPHHRTLYICSEGRFLSWKPTKDEHITSIRKAPRLDLSQCIEVRHAHSEDQQHPRYTGTTILRQKCKVRTDARKSLSLVFQNRTVDMTAENSDQCQILLEGFSALCYHLHLSLDTKKAIKSGKRVDLGLFDDDASTSSTLFGSSLTLKNNSATAA